MPLEVLSTRSFSPSRPEMSVDWDRRAKSTIDAAERAKNASLSLRETSAPAETYLQGERSVLDSLQRDRAAASGGSSALSFVDGEIRRQARRLHAAENALNEHANFELLMRETDGTVEALKRLKRSDHPVQCAHYREQAATLIQTLETAKRAQREPVGDIFKRIADERIDEAERVMILREVASRPGVTIFDHPEAGAVFHAPEIDGRPLHQVQLGDDDCSVLAANAALGRPVLDAATLRAHQDSIQAMPDFLGVSDVPLTERRRPSTDELSTLLSPYVRERGHVTDPQRLLKYDSGSLADVRDAERECLSRQTRHVRNAAALLLLGGNHWTALVPVGRDARVWTHVDTLDPHSQSTQYDAPDALAALRQHSDRRNVENVLTLAE